MTEDDVRRIVSEHLRENRKIDDNTAQWLARAAFEAGWRSGGDDGDWRQAWINSEPRAMLVRLGVISGQEDWR